MSEKQFNEYLREFEPVIKHKSGYKIQGMDKDDIANEIRLEIWMSRDNFDPSKSMFGTWARVVADRKIMKLVRKSKTITQGYLNEATLFSELEEESQKDD